MTFLTALNGNPFVVHVASGVFDVDGLFTFGGSSAPGTAGNLLTFRSFALNAIDQVERSNEASLDIQ